VRGPKAKRAGLGPETGENSIGAKARRVSFVKLSAYQTAYL
jgi:hypothetical protein